MQQLITLVEAKRFLNVTHSFDDQHIIMLMEGANAEALSYMCREAVDSWDIDNPDAPPPSDVVVAVGLLIKAAYEGTPDDMDRMRRIALKKIDPYRKGLGI